MRSIAEFFRSFLTDKNFYFLLVASLVLFVLAYQWHAPVDIPIGAVLDVPYLDNFHPPHRTPQETYRTTRKDSRIVLQGLGTGVPRRVTLDVKSTVPTARGMFSVAINGLHLTDLQAGKDWSKHSLIVQDPRLIAASDWVIGLHANTDIALREVRVEPLQLTAGEPRVLSGISTTAPVVPDLRRVGYLTLTVLILYVTLVGVGLKRRWSFIAAFSVLLILAALLAFARLYLTIVTLQLALLVLVCALMVALAAWLLPGFYRWGGIQVTRQELMPLLLIFFIVLLMKFGGEFYPQFHSSDLLYHQHRLERVMTGDLFFLTQSPEFGNQQIPLAPGFYAFLTSLTTLVPDRGLLLQVASVLADATSIFFIYYLAKKFTGNGRVGWIAGLVYAFTPITFLMLSAGNIPNIFSQWLLLALIVVVLANFSRLSDRAVFFSALFLFFVAGVSHLGNLIVMATLLVAISAVTLLLSSAKPDRKNAGILLLLVFAGSLLAFVLYYSDFVGLLVQEATGILVNKFGGGVRVAGTLNFAKVPLAISLAVIGGGLIGSLIGRPLMTPMFRRAMLAWYLSAGLFVLAAQFIGVYVRYNIFVLPALGIGVGLGCVWLLRRWRWSYPLVILYLGYVVWVGASFWFQRVMFSYH